MKTETYVPRSLQDDERTAEDQVVATGLYDKAGVPLYRRLKRAGFVLEKEEPT